MVESVKWYVTFSDTAGGTTDIYKIYPDTATEKALTIDKNGDVGIAGDLTIKSGKLTANNGMKVVAGVLEANGGLTVGAGMLQANGGLTVGAGMLQANGGLTVGSGMLQANAGLTVGFGMLQANGGVTANNAPLTANGGFNITGGSAGAFGRYIPKDLTLVTNNIRAHDSSDKSWTAETDGYFIVSIDTSEDSCNGNWYWNACLSIVAVKTWTGSSMTPPKDALVVYVGGGNTVNTQQPRQNKKWQEEPLDKIFMDRPNPQSLCLPIAKGAKVQALVKQVDSQHYARCKAWWVPLGSGDLVANS